ncbi:MAG: hypothetical protein DYG94_01740 [Leptolyngbya sp. PLA3]|nr:MAG: hypothetical protein EDM82_00145 [Cyanobacteria bacterium CYA]MCE7967454.1 hypothetical protein [Leptolyngbya sp. PL-A3]
MQVSNMWTRFITLFAAIVLAVSAAVSGADTVVLKDGTKVEGVIERELEGSVWIKTSIGGIETVQFILAENIAKIDRTAKPAEEAKPAPNAASSDPKPRRAGVPRGVVISLEGTVGIQMAAKTLEDMIPILEKEIGNDGTGIVVFKINSGGGLLLEIQKLSDVIHLKYKPKFRTVSWIESAISAAAMTSHCIEEIYFLPEGNYGACTGWFGALQAVSGEGLEEVLFMMEKISARGGYAPEIMRAMQINEPLSCTIDEQTGKVTWYQKEEGEYLVNKGESILTFTAPQALKYGFSKGTAKDLEELTRALGYQEIDWVGEVRPGFIYPVSKSEDFMLSYRKKVTDDEARTNEYFGNYQQAFAAAAGTQDPELRARFVGRARKHLRSIESMVRNNPNFALLRWGMELKDWERDWLKVQQEELAKLLRN